MKTKTIIASICACAVLIGSIGLVFYLRAVIKKKSVQAAIVKDISDSSGSSCDSTFEIVDEILTLPNTTAENSSVALITTGTKATAYEPQLSGIFKLPHNRLVFHGKNAEKKLKEQLRQDFNSKCLAVEPSNVSPIYLGVKRGVEYLRRSGFPESELYLYVQTDGEDTIEEKMKAALDAKNSTNLILPSAISNEGIHIVFCGLAEVVGEKTDNANAKVKQLAKPHDQKRIEQIKNVWSSLFTQPDSVEFRPYCKNQPAQ